MEDSCLGYLGLDQGLFMGKSYVACSISCQQKNDEVSNLHCMWSGTVKFILGIYTLHFNKHLNFKKYTYYQLEVNIREL